MLEKVREFAKEKHKNQKDDDGLSYFYSHIEHVVSILKLVTEDVDILCAAYLHDTIEDTQTTYEELKKEFNERIANLVMEVTHERQKDEYGYYFPRLETKDGILIKFADRLSNLSRMSCWPLDRQQQYLNKSKFWKSERIEPVIKKRLNKVTSLLEKNLKDIVKINNFLSTQGLHQYNLMEKEIRSVLKEIKE